MQPSELECSRTYPVPGDRAFDVVLPIPLPQLFSRRYLAIPPVRQVDQDGDWGTSGQSRTIRLADGGTMRETLTSVDRPASFGYRLSDLTGPLKPLVDRIDGRWLFAPAGVGGVRVTWAWTVFPRSGLGAAAMPAFGRIWQGYARQALEQLEAVLVT
jgi:hypothetical protein